MRSREKQISHPSSSFCRCLHPQQGWAEAKSSTQIFMWIAVIQLCVVLLLPPLCIRRRLELVVGAGRLNPTLWYSVLVTRPFTCPQTRFLVGKQNTSILQVKPVSILTLRRYCSFFLLFLLFPSFPFSSSPLPLPHSPSFPFFQSQTYRDLLSALSLLIWQLGPGPSQARAKNYIRVSDIDCRGSSTCATRIWGCTVSRELAWMWSSEEINWHPGIQMGIWSLS